MESNAHPTRMTGNLKTIGFIIFFQNLCDCERASQTLENVWYIKCNVLSVLCPKVVSQAPHQFRAPETQATCDGCFVCQSVCSVISPDSSMYKAVESVAVFEDGNVDFQTSVKISQTKQSYMSPLHAQT